MSESSGRATTTSCRTPNEAAAVSSCTAICLADLEKSSLPIMRNVVYANSNDQNGTSGRLARLACTATTASFATTAMSKPMLSDSDTSVVGTVRRTEDVEQADPTVRESVVALDGPNPVQAV